LDRTTARVADPCAMVIFGASGDLTKRKLIPALYNLAKENLLSKDFALIGFARAPMSSEDYRDRLSEEISQFATTKIDPELWKWFSQRIYYVQGDADDPEAYKRLKAMLAQTDTNHGTRGNYFFYLAVSPNFFCTIVKRLGEAGLADEN